MQVKIELKRSPRNPILTPTENGWENRSVCNCGVVEIDGTIYLIYSGKGKKSISRSRYGMSKFGLATLEGTDKIKERLNYPIFEPREYFEIDSVEDPRAHIIQEFKDRIDILYAGKERDMSRVCKSYISIDDFKKKKWNWTPHQMLMEPIMHYHDRNGVYFPRKIKGQFAVLHRPVTLSSVIPSESIWIMWSHDFWYWYGNKAILQPREGFWDDQKVGPAGPPIELDEGWLLVYHGVDARTHTYRLGYALLDKENPEKVLYRAEEPFLEPEEKYEIEGKTPRVVFSCGHIVRDKELILYYGGADKVIGVAQGKIEIK